MTVISEEIQEMMKRIDIGEMKIVEATVKLVVPNNVPSAMVKYNIYSGISYIIEEHLFVIEPHPEYDMELGDFPYDVEIVDDIEILDIAVCDVKLEGKAT